MKTKVLTYANDGNTVCNKYMDIFPVSYCENIFTTCPDEYQRSSLIFKFKDIYYCEGNYNNSQLVDNPDTVLNHYNTYLPGLVTHKWIKSIYIALYESLGMDASGLISARTQIQEQRQADKENKENEKRQLAEQCKQKRLNELTEAKSKLTAGASELFADIHADNNKLVLSVKDNGVGFNPKHEMAGHSNSLSVHCHAHYN